LRSKEGPRTLKLKKGRNDIIVPEFAEVHDSELPRGYFMIKNQKTGKFLNDLGKDSS